MKKLTIATMASMLVVSPIFADVREGAQSTGGYITITFDDGLATQFTNGLRIARQHDIQGTIYISTKGVEIAEQFDDAWGMTWAQVRTFAHTGWEIAAHTHSHPYLTHLPDDEIVDEFLTGKQLIEEEVGITPVSFASPYGDYDDRVVGLAQEYFESHVKGWGGNKGRNRFSEDDPYYIGRRDVKHTTAPEQICGEMLQASIDGTWTIFIFHHIVDGEPKEYQVSSAAFDRMMQCAATLRDQGLVEAITVAEGVKLLQ